MKKQKSASFWVAIALILCLISSLGASMVQTSGGAIKYHDITMVTDSGHELDALLLVPKNATRENPAPAIVTSHGWYNNREMQDLNYVEYARRGYVVISISMYGHGDSEIIPDGTWFNAENNANGLYDAVKYIARLPYVDASRIGVTGHSNGALASRVAVMQDEEGLIAAALLVSNDAVYQKDNQWVNIFGSRDAGIFLTLLNDEEQAAHIIAPPADRSESVLLGEDLEPQIPGLCIVSDRYLVGGGLWGTVALIGPTRMPFQKLMPLLHLFADELGEGMSGKRKDTPQMAAPRRTVIYKEDLE